MYIFRSPWTLFGNEDSIYITSMPRWPALERKFGPDTVRKFETNSEAAEFFHLENADPPRLHYCSIVGRIALRCFIYGMLDN